MKVGTLEWGRRTGGRLSWSEQWGQVLQSLQGLLANASGRWLRKWGLGGRRSAAAWQGLQLPASALARATRDFCGDCSPPYLVQHCLRSYAWAVLLAQRDDLHYDAESLYLACLLHDLGLTPHALPHDGTSCFAISGALAAQRFLSEQCYPAEKTRLVAEAIALHLNARVLASEGTEAHLLRQGAGLDVVGLRFSHISREARAQVLQLYPRENMKQQLCCVLNSPPIKQSGTRIALLGRLGFSRMIQTAPFDS